MKQDSRNPTPVLNGAKLEFFYGILTLWESGVEKKVIKTFNSAEIKRFLARRDTHGRQVLFFTSDRNKSGRDCKYELFVKDSKRNQGMSLLYHLRNAFAHNDIRLSNDGNDIHIQHTYNGVLKLKTKIPFKLLKELVETIRGYHNLTPEEKRKPIKRNNTK